MKYFSFLILAVMLMVSCNKPDDYSTKINPNQAVPIDTSAQIALSGGIKNILYRYDGLNRKFIIQLPLSFDPQKTYPVVFAFHGGTIRYIGWQDLIGNMINEREYIGIYPSAVDTAFNIGVPGSTASIDDAGYIRQITYWLNTRTNVKTDPARYYAMGVGTGGAFVHYLALHSTQFAAIAPISASLASGMIGKATHTQHTPVMQVHGDPDEGILYGGGAGLQGTTWEPAQNSIKLWAARNGCGNAPVVSTASGMTRYVYPEFVGAEESTLYVASGVTSVYSEVDRKVLNNLVWDFFGRHSK